MKVWNVRICTFAPTVLECWDVALDGFESVTSRFYMLFVIVPFECFCAKARIVDFLIRHCMLLCVEKK